MKRHLLRLIVWVVLIPFSAEQLVWASATNLGQTLAPSYLLNKRDNDNSRQSNEQSPTEKNSNPATLAKSYIPVEILPYVTALRLWLTDAFKISFFVTALHVLANIAGLVGPTPNYPSIGELIKFSSALVIVYISLWFIPRYLLNVIRAHRYSLRVMSTPSPFPSSTLGAQFQLPSRKVKIGDRTFHVIGVAHGSKMMPLSVRKIHALVRELRKRQIPLLSEQNFKSLFRYMDGVEIQDHSVMLIPTDLLNRHDDLLKYIDRFGTRREEYMARTALADSSGSQEVVLAVGLGHMDEVAKNLKVLGEDLKSANVALLTVL